MGQGVYPIGCGFVIVVLELEERLATNIVCSAYSSLVDPDLVELVLPEIDASLVVKVAPFGLNFQNQGSLGTNVSAIA